MEVFRGGLWALDTMTSSAKSWLQRSSRGGDRDLEKPKTFGGLVGNKGIDYIGMIFSYSLLTTSKNNEKAS